MNYVTRPANPDFRPCPVRRYCNTILINMGINSLGKTKRWKEAVAVFERMSTDLGHAPDSMTYSLVINSLALVRPLFDVLSSPRRFHSVTSVARNLSCRS